MNAVDDYAVAHCVAVLGQGQRRLSLVATDMADDAETCEGDMITQVTLSIWGVLPPGVRIEPDTVFAFDVTVKKPRIRVQSGRRVISMDQYFRHGMQWTPEEARRFERPGDIRWIEPHEIQGWMR